MKKLCFPFFVVIMLIFCLGFDFFVYASNVNVTPYAVTGKSLRRGIKLGDNSNWIEIAVCGDYSLILRVNCLPSGAVKFDLNKEKYDGYAGSNVKAIVDDWFYNLKYDCDLKRYAVGNTSISNLGHYHLDVERFGNIYSYSGHGEARGTGLSLPVLRSKIDPAFILSYQEARKYVCAEYDFFDRSSNEAIENYKKLVSANSTFWSPSNLETSWLRSPGNSYTSASSSGCTFLNQCVFSSNIKKCHYVRPAIWVSSEIFTGKPSKIKEVMKPLDFFVGMEELKSTVKKMAERKLNNPKDDSNYHMVLMGNSGTGKTTVINKIAESFFEAGITINKKVVNVEQADLVGCYVGENAQKIKDKIKEARGGILFIDEAYTLATGNIHDQKVIDGLLTSMENKECIVIVAGYQGKMKTFLESNPGLNSRFRNQVTVLDLTAGEMLQLFENFCKVENLLLNDDAKIYLLKLFSKIKPEEFGSGRGVKNLFLDVRAIQIQDRSSPKYIKGQHIIDATVTKFEKPEMTIEDSMKPFEELVGMNKLKSLISDLMCDVKQAKIDFEQGIDLPKPILHMMLTGNPGTGKTTVANMLGEIYHKAGLIRKNSVIKVERKDLVSDHIGGTEKRVKEILDNAAGGILFIDEAYSLAGKGDNDFGRQVIEGLLTSMTENKCVIIAAGYTKEMDEFLNSNSGLQRRFAHIVNLDDYTAQELYQIFKNICAKNNLILAEDAENILIEHFNNIRMRLNFGNAGYVEKFFQDVKRVRNRILPQTKPQNDQESLERKTISKKFIEEAIRLKN